MGIVNELRDFILSRILRGETVEGSPGSGSGVTKSGKVVTAAEAVRNPTIRAAMRVLAEDVATVPRHLYRRDANGDKHRAEDHWLYRLFENDPNPSQTGVEYRELETYNLVGWGNHFVFIQLDPFFNAVPVAMWPLRVDRMSVIVLENGMRQYAYSSPTGEPEIFTADQIVHVMGLSSDGFVGQSVFSLHAEALGIKLAVEDYTAQYFGQGNQTGGFVIHPTNLSDDAVEKLKKKLNDQSGVANAHKWGVLREDMKVFEVKGQSASEAQMLETRKFEVEETARMFRIPPDKLGDLTHATFSNIEQQATNYVVYSLRPWLVRLEAAYNKRLVDRFGYEPGLYLEHNIDGLTRGDLQSRYTAYAQGRQWGWYSANDIRRKENENPIPGGDTYLTPINMADANAPKEPPAV